MNIEAYALKEAEEVIGGYKWAERDLQTWKRFRPEYCTEGSALRRGYELYMAEQALVEEANHERV